MNAPALQCRPELLRQWADDVAANPRAFVRHLELFPQYAAMLVHDAAAAHDLQQRAQAELQAAAAQHAPCRLCHQVTETVGWRCSGQCAADPDKVVS